MLLLGILLAFSNDATARTLTWSQCVDWVSKNNPDLMVAIHNLDSNDELLGSSRSGFLPSVTGAVNANYNFPQAAGSPVKSTDTNKVLYSSSVTATYNLFSGFRDAAKIEQAKANRSIAEQNLRAAKAKSSLALRTAYAQWTYARDLVNLSLAIQERRSLNERLVRAQYESGRENEGSHLLSKSLLEQAEYETETARHAFILAAQGVAHVLGMDEEELALQGEIPVAEPDKNLKPETLLSQTPNHLIQEYQVRLAEANTKLTRGGFFPSLDLSGSLANRDNVVYESQNQQWSLGLSLTIPFFTGLKTYHDLRSNLALEKSATSNLTSQDLETLNQLRQSYFTYLESVMKLRVSENNLKAYTVQESIARKRYQNGLITFESWDLIETNLIGAQKSALNAKKDRIVSESTWRQLQGLGDF